MYGNYSRNIDQKNRVIVPSKFRSKLGAVVYITLGPDHIFELRSSKSFNEYQSKLLSNNMLNKNARLFARVLLGNTFEGKFDGLGRIVIPDNFKKTASITKEVVFVGVGNKVELWPKNAFENFQNQFEKGDTIDSLAKQLLKDGAEL